MDQYIVQVVIGYVMTFVLEFLKKASWFPVFTDNAMKGVKIATAWVAAACSALAVTWTYDPTLGQVLITGLSWSNIKGGLTAFVVSLMAQKFTWKLAVKEPV
jgi:hypothetical protein